MGHTTTRTRENQTITINFRDVTATAGVANGKRVRRGFQDKKAGWYAVFADPQMPATSVLLDQAHNAIERKLFAIKGFYHPGGSQ